MLKYSLVFFSTFLILTFLKFVEDSPVRSWKTVFLAGLPLGLVIGYYLNWVTLKPKPTPEPQKISNYRGELERTIRHIKGVQGASINGSRIDIDFAADVPRTKFREVALQSGGTAAFFMKPNGSSNLTVTIHMTVLGQDAYEMIYDTKRGVIHETDL